MNTKKTSNKSTTKSKSTPKKIVLINAVESLINKYQALPSIIVRDLVQRATKKQFSQSAVSSALRKAHAAGRIGRLTNGVYCHTSLKKK